MQTLIQWVWNGAWDAIFLTTPQVRAILLSGPHLSPLSSGHFNFIVTITTWTGSAMYVVVEYRDDHDTVSALKVTV